MNSIQLLQISPDELAKIITKGITPKIQELLQQQQENSKQGKEFLTREETKDFFSISYVCLHDWVKKGILTPYKTGNKTFFKRSELVDTLLSSNRRA